MRKHRRRRPTLIFPTGRCQPDKIGGGCHRRGGIDSGMSDAGREGQITGRHSDFTSFLQIMTRLRDFPTWEGMRHETAGSLSVLADIHIHSCVSMHIERWRVWSVTLSLWIWCALLSFSLFTINTIDLDATRTEALGYQAVGLLQFILVASAVVPLRAAMSVFRYSSFQLTIVLVILLSLILQFHGSEAAILGGLAYTVALLVVIACLSAVWTLPQDALAVALGGISVIFVTFGLSALAVFGWPHDRVIGTIHPNAFGSVMLAGFVLSQFGGGLMMVGLRAVCLIEAAAVSSRFAVIGCLVAFLTFELTFRPLSLRLPLLGLAALSCLLLFPHALSELLALDDPTRNLDSGFTGRDDLWGLALKGIAEAPLGLGFKRPPLDISGHNGYLRLLLEFGVLGGGLIIASIGCVVATALIETRLTTTHDESLRRFASARAGGLAALMFAAFFQPQLFNLGDVHGLAVMLMLFSRRIDHVEAI